MGAELIKRGLTPRTGLWSARALLDEPEGVVQVHAEYIEAGASVITTNSYSTIPSYLAKADMAESYQELTVVAAKLARRAADAAAIPVRVAGCLPPLDESYRHDLVPEDEPVTSGVSRARHGFDALCGSVPLRDHVLCPRGGQRIVRRLGLLIRTNRFGWLGRCTKPLARVYGAVSHWLMP
jgi:hypothetical protein